MTSSIHFDVVCRNCGHVIDVGKGSASEYIEHSCPMCGSQLGADNQLLTRYVPSTEPPAKKTSSPAPSKVEEIERALAQAFSRGDFRMIKSLSRMLESEREFEKEQAARKKELKAKIPETISDPAFSARLKSIMTDNKYDRKIPKRRKGRLDSHSLWRAKVGAENVFRQKQERKNKDYHVVLLIDLSGSMHGTIDRRDPESQVKYEAAIEQALFMAETLEKVEIAFTIMGFNCGVHIFKESHQTLKKLSKVKIRNNILRVLRTRWGENHDYQGLLAGYEKLKGDKHGKVLMVFSDGAPSTCHRDADCYEHFGRKLPESIWELNQDDPAVLRNLVLAHKDVTTIGVGLDSHVVEGIYPKHVLVESLADFKPKVLNALKSAIKRG